MRILVHSTDLFGILAVGNNVQLSWEHTAMSAVLSLKWGGTQQNGDGYINLHCKKRIVLLTKTFVM